MQNSHLKNQQIYKSVRVVQFDLSTLFPARVILGFDELSGFISAQLLKKKKKKRKPEAMKTP